MKQNFLIKTFVLLIALVGGVNVSWATETAIPLTVGNYLTTSTSVTTGSIKNNDGGNLGSIYKDATATFTLTNESAQDMVLTFLTGNNNNSSPQVTVTMNDGTKDFFTKTVDIENTGGWTPITKHVFDVGEVPAETITLTFAFTNTSSYVCNLGSIGLYNKTSYLATLDEMPGDITLNKGTYNTAKIENAGNVGFMSNGATAYYPSLYVSNGGLATLNIGLYHYGDGTLNVKITDLSTGEVEVNEDLDITEEKCQGLTTTTAFELGNITAGYKAMKFTVSTSASYLVNYKALSLSIDSWTPITIDLRSGQLGTSGSNLQKYLTIDGETYNYADDEPTNYNALLSAGSYNGSDHGYVNFKAKVPVKAGIYKITLGTCQYGTGTGYVKNADESSTLDIVDENGQTATSFNQNTGACYHNNTTANVISLWYEAESDETITIVCGNYTPYFSIESVNAVPELKYVVTYANNTSDVEGTVPGVVYAAAGNSVTLPVNRTLYKDGYTLTGWNDGTTTYEPGDSYTPEANTTMTAVFTANTYTFDQTVSEMTVRWDFQRENGCPTISMQGTGATTILVQQASVNGTTMDMKLDIDATSGKFANGSWTDWAQVNEGTTFSFPSVEGTTVKAYSMNEPKNNSDVKSSVDDNDYSSYASYIASYDTTPENNASTLTVKGGGYYRYIDVTYPAAAITGITELTVDGVAVGSDIIAAINNGDDYTATLSGNTYTTLPAVQATFDTGAQATGEVSGTGTSRTYTITQADHTYTLVVEGIHVYTTTGDEESINIKYNEGTVENNVWTDGVYTMTTTGIGSSGGADFKFDADTDASYTISVPADVVVKQFIIKNFHANYSGGNGQLKTVTSTGATTYIPTKHACVYSGETTAANRTYEGPAYDLVVTVEDHTAGTPIVFTMLKSAQPMGWIQLVTVKEDPSTAPQKTDQNVTVVNNHAVVAVTFDREIPNDVTATINNATVTAEGGATTLYFSVWDLSYSTNYALTIAAGAVEDAYGNTNSSAINIAVNTAAKPAVTQATYDYVVSNADELDAAITALQTSNRSANAARKTVFLKNGNYTYGTLSGSYQHNVSLKIDNWNNIYNVSFIGESKDGVVIEGTTDGITSSTLNLGNGTGIYVQDMTIRNNYDFPKENRFKGVSVAVSGGNKAVLKNVAMQACQDTYVTGQRTYLENCDIYGTVDFICGGGDIFFNQCDLILVDRGGDVIVAPNTTAATKWGYVFQHCTVKAEDEATNVTDESWNLGRPWQNEPRAYFLNTTMEVLPTDNGWAGMGNLPTHFYEYNSLDANGDALDLSVRGNSSSSTNSYIPVLTSSEAAKFTVENVLGGTDSWLPTDETVTTAAPSLSMSGTTLSWDAVSDARCYVIFKDGEYYANQTETSIALTEAGTYTVKAANLNGGLGAESPSKTYVILDQAVSYVASASTNTSITLTRTIAADKWNTIVLPFDMDADQITSTFGESTQVAELSSLSDDVLHFTSVTSMNANEPYLIKVANDFTTATINGVTIEEGTPSKTTVSGVDFVGSYDAVTDIPASDEDYTYYFISNNALYSTANSDTSNKMRGMRAYFKVPGSTAARQLSFVVDEEGGEATGVSAALNDKGQMTNDKVVYDLQGRKVAQPTNGLYIVNGKKVLVP